MLLLSPLNCAKKKKKIFFTLFFHLHFVLHKNVPSLCGSILQCNNLLFPCTLFLFLNHLLLKSFSSLVVSLYISTTYVPRSTLYVEGIFPFFLPLYISHFQDSQSKSYCPPVSHAEKCTTEYIRSSLLPSLHIAV